METKKLIKISKEKLVDAYQRLSTWLDKDKKKTARKFVSNFDSDEIQKLIEDDIIIFTRIANNDFMIRHTEIGIKEIKTEETLEYLYYGFYNNIRALIKSHNREKENK